jgi:RNA polymerase sigma-70 factor (ECF subfamily)
MSAAEFQPVSFEELAVPLFDQLYNFAHWLTRDRSEAEDLVQETYTKALRGFSSFQLGTNFRAWMYRILRNTFLTSRTGLKATMTVPLEPEEDNLELPIERETQEAMLIERSNWQLIQNAIEELPLHYRGPNTPCNCGCDWNGRWIRRSLRTRAPCRRNRDR